METKSPNKHDVKWNTSNKEVIFWTVLMIWTGPYESNMTI